MFNLQYEQQTIKYKTYSSIYNKKSTGRKQINSIKKCYVLKWEDWIKYKKCYTINIVF